MGYHITPCRAKWLVHHQSRVLFTIIMCYRTHVLNSCESDYPPKQSHFSVNISIKQCPSPMWTKVSRTIVSHVSALSRPPHQERKATPLFYASLCVTLINTQNGYNDCQTRDWMSSLAWQQPRWPPGRARPSRQHVTPPPERSSRTPPWQSHK